MYVYLIINGFDITASQQEVENLIINVAAGNMTNVELAYWLEKNTIEIYKIYDFYNKKGEWNLHSPFLNINFNANHKYFKS